jgi:PAS domain S-box-containing protein
MLDPNGLIASWNPGAERIKQYRAEEVIGRHLSLFYPPEDIQCGNAEAELAEAAAEGYYEEEAWRVRKDGSRFWANVVITPLRSEAGELRGFCKITRDMTVRREAEETARRLLEEEAARRAAEQQAAAILKQRERLRVTLQSIGDGVIATDAEGRVTLLNPVAEALTGWTSAEAAGQSIQTVFPIVNEFTREELENPVARVLREGRVVGLANHTIPIASSGVERPLDDSAAPIRDDQGRVLGVVLVFRDATEQRASERRRAAQVVISPILTEAGKIRERAPRIVKALCETPGFSAGASWLGDPHVAEMHNVAFWHTESLPAEAVLEASRVTGAGGDSGLSGRIRESGRPEWIADLGSDPGSPWTRDAASAGLRAAFGFPIPSGEGVLGVIELFHREVREPDAALEGTASTIGTLIGQFIERGLAEQRLRLLWEAAAVILSSSEPEAMLRELFASIAPHLGLDAYFNYVVDEAGESLRLVSSVGIPEADAGRLARLEFGQAICGTVAASGRAIVASHVQRSDDPRVQVVKSFGIRAYACNPLQVDNDLLGTLSFGSRSRDEFEPEELEFLETICHYVAVAYERLRLVRRLREADRRKDDFLATLAHELRNPLAPIRNAVELLRRASDDDAVVDEAQHVLERQVDQMVRLIDDLLDLGRISRGKVHLRKQRVELAEVLDSAVETARPLIESQRHELVTELPSEAIQLDGDPTRLAQVIANLLNNAAKYTEKGGQIRLKGERQGAEAVVSIRDNGIGLSAEHLPHVFEMFSQAVPALARSQGGLGIGLALVRGLVELHGGRVEAQSGGIGAGSEFRVHLPVVDMSLPHEPPEPVEDGRGRGDRKCRILVVDDHRDAADSLARLLRLMGHDTHTSYDGQEALQAATAVRPQVVLLDIGLPRLNGYDVARQIRQQPWGKGMILVALTGWGQQEDKRRASEAGFDHHMTKPVDVAALESLLAAPGR